MGGLMGCLMGSTGPMGSPMGQAMGRTMDCAIGATPLIGSSVGCLIETYACHRTLMGWD